MTKVTEVTEVATASDAADSKQMNGVAVRHAKESDLTAINRVSNHYIETSHVTFDLEAYSAAKRREWFAAFGETGRCQLFVAVRGRYTRTDPYARTSQTRS